MKKPRTRWYEVTLRRDVQQVARVRTEATSPQDAIDVSEAIADSVVWNVEKHLGSHRSVAVTRRPSKWKARDIKTTALLITKRVK